MQTKTSVKVYFSDFFNISKDTVKAYGAFNISLINDLPLFIDPFLLFNSPKEKYRKLHDGIINYLRYLRDVSTAGEFTTGGLRAWFTFSEIKQNWLGFSVRGNSGSGLGLDFAKSLNRNLYKVFTNFGKEKITHGSHLEKLCLIGSGVGRDNISDFTTNLIKEYLLEYTQEFAREHLTSEQRRRMLIPRVRFNLKTEMWEAGEYELPYIFNDFVMLTPKDILTKDDVWINRADMAQDYDNVIASVPDGQLRAQLNNYLYKQLALLPNDATKKQRDEAALSLYIEYPEMIDFYIRYKEDHGDTAIINSDKVVEESRNFYIEQVSKFVETLNNKSSFYKLTGGTYSEAKQRVMFLKDVIENKGGHRIFYKNGKSIRSESDLQILYRLTWFGTPSDISREVNDGRGPVDFKVSRGAPDISVVEFKLASNTRLQINLQNQVEIYQKASDAKKAIKVIVYFTRQELNRVKLILKKLGLDSSPDIILIDARNDNKPSGSRATTDNEEDIIGKFDFGDLGFDFSEEN